MRMCASALGRGGKCLVTLATLGKDGLGWGRELSVSLKSNRNKAAAVYFKGRCGVYELKPSMVKGSK